MDHSEFRSVLAEAVRRSGLTKRAFAQAIGLAPSALSHLLRQDGRPPNPVLCLRVAQVSGMSPFTVLHAADRQDVADLLRSLFGAQPAPAAEALTPEERRVLRRLRALSVYGRRVVRTIVHALSIAEGQRAAPP